MASRLRSRSRFGGLTQYQALRNLAIDAARRNNASLWFAGTPADLAGFTFQDSTGITPATGTDPIGLMLDRSYGAGNLGPDVLGGNGNFATPAYWGVDASVSIAENRANWSAAATGAAIFRNVPLTSGKTYNIEFDIVSISGGALAVDTNGGSVNTPSRNTVGRYSCRAVITTTFVIIRAVGTTTAAIENLTVREVLGIPALQATAANKPTLSPNSAGYLDMSFDVTNDTLSAALASGGSPAVVSFTDTGEVTGFVSATTSGFVIGNPTIGGRRVGVIVASATALPAADLAAIRAFAGVVRGAPYP